jgi:hypothetical protein
LGFVSLQTFAAVALGQAGSARGMSEFADKPTSARYYVALSAGWTALLGAILLAGRDRDEEPVAPGEALPLGVATFALAKLVTKEKVDAWVREPFVEVTEDGRRPKGEGLRYVMGELLTCTRCTGMWSALGLVGLRVLRPRESRIVTTVLTATAVNDAAQAGFSWLTATTNVTERTAGEPAPGAIGEPASADHDERDGRVRGGDRQRREPVTRSRDARPPTRPASRT